MKPMLYTFAALLLLSGCSQSKNRLADDNNVEYQKRNASQLTKPAAPKEVVDVPTVSKDEDQSRVQSQKQKTAEPTPTPDIPDRSESAESASPSAPVVKNEKPKAAAPVATAPTPKPAAPAATAPAAAAPAASAPAASAPAAAAPAQRQTPHLLSFDEYLAITNALKQNFAAPEEIKVILTGFINVEQNPNVDTQKLAPAIRGSYEKLAAAILHDGKTLTMIQDVALTLDGKLLQAEATNDYKFHAACAGEKCDILFIGFYKNTGDKVSSNFPCFFKRVGDQYVIAGVKPKEDYEAEANKRASQAPATAQK